MKKITLILAFIVSYTISFGQTLTFNSKGASNIVKQIRATNQRTGQTVNISGNALILNSTNGIHANTVEKEKTIAYPNPFQEKTRVSFTAFQNEKVEIKLINTIGQILISKDIDATEGENSIEISAPKCGCYLIHINGKSINKQLQVICNRANNGSSKIAYLSNQYTKQVPVMKVAKEEVVFNYIQGDKIDLKCISGDYITFHVIDPYKDNKPNNTYLINFEPKVSDFEGNVYKTVTIGTQVWIAENLKSTFYPNGTVISGFDTYDNNATNKGVYGLLYPVNSITNIAPTGWHLPSFEEIRTLSTYLGGENFKYKLFENSATDCGFAAKLAGVYYGSYYPSGIPNPNPRYEGLGNETSFWCSGERLYYISSTYSPCENWGGGGTEASVRCIKN